MRKPHELAVIVPAFNEATVIEASLTQLSAWLGASRWDWEIRVVDDGSDDRTAAIVRRFARAEPRVMLQVEPHRGKGAAVRAGMLASDAAYRFLCDADLSMPPHEIARFMPPHLGETDVAIASREGVGARRIDEPFLRHLAGRAFNSTVRAGMLPGIEDTQCGFKMFTAAAAEAIFPYVTVDGWAFDIEVLYLARRRGFRVREVPIEWHFRADTRLRLFPDAFRMFNDLLSVRLRAWRGDYDRRYR